MTPEELIVALRKLHDHGDEEVAHREADVLLLAFIDDAGVREAFEAVPKWYA